MSILTLTVPTTELEEVWRESSSEYGFIIGGNWRKFQGKCFQCGKMGHTKRNCPQVKRGGKPVNCYWCGKIGHLANKCPARLAGKPKMRINQIVDEDKEPQWEEMTEEQIDELVAQEEGETINAIQNQGFPFGGL